MWKRNGISVTDEGKMRILRSKHGSYEEDSHTYEGFFNKSHVHNMNHGNLDTMGHYHGSFP